MRLLLIVVSTLVCLDQGLAYYSVMDTGTILNEGNYKLNIESQFVTSEDEGVNFVGRFDLPHRDDGNFKALFGFGTTDFQFGGFYKWVPIPDYNDQPAIGVIAGLQYARFDNIDDFSVRATPIISKKFAVSFGAIEPYAGLPIGLRNIDGESDVPVQFALGTHVMPSSLEAISFSVEFGFDVSKAFNYFSVGLNFAIDDQQGFRFE